MAETIEIKSCPMCGNDAPASAPRCPCGYVFSSAETAEAVEWEPSASSGAPGDGWGTAGWALSVIGALGLAVGFFMDTSIGGYGYGDGDIVNLDLMFQKGVVIACGLSAIGLGVFCHGVGAVVKAIGRKG